MAQTAIGRCFIRLFGKRSKHCRTLLSSSCPAAHNFRREFDTAAADHSDAAYRLFVRETIQFLALQLEQTFPDTPILPALGNDDLYCGNYQLQPQGPFLADTLPILRALVGTLVSLGFDRNG